MSWLGVQGHDEIADRLRTVLRRGRLASSFLFVGPDGVGKRTFALAFAKSLLCQQVATAELQPCGVCESCVQADAATHPDILQVAKPADKSQLPIDLLIGDKEHRMRTGLCYEIGLKPFMGGRKVAIIDDETNSPVRTLAAGEYFGEIALVTNQPRTATVRTESSVEVAVLGKENFLNMMRLMPTTEGEILHTIQTRVMADSSRHGEEQG